jgi:hypothetical protein
MSGRRLTDLMLCLDIIRLMLLKVVLTEGRKVTDTGFSGAGDQGASLQWAESLSDLPVAVAILPESGPEKLQLIM